MKTLQLDAAERRALMREYLRLEEAENLPATADFEGLLSQPRTGVGWARQVAQSRLWLLYRLVPGKVQLHELTGRRPTQVDG